MANFKPSVVGVFTSPLDNYEPARHTIRASLSQGLQLSRAFANAIVEKTTKGTPMPDLIQFLDVNTGNINSMITKNGIGQIDGLQLKFDPEVNTEGIFFVNDGGLATKVAIMQRRTEGVLVFVIPGDLLAGSYTLEVRSTYGQVGNIRTGVLQHILTVQA